MGTPGWAHWAHTLSMCLRAQGTTGHVHLLGENIEMTEHRRFKEKRIGVAVRALSEAYDSVKEQYGEDVGYGALQILAGVPPDPRYELEEYEEYRKEVDGWTEAFITEAGRAFDKAGVANPIDELFDELASVDPESGGH